MEIRPVRPEEWLELRQLRLRALNAAPDAFSSTVTDDTALDADEWRRRAIATPQQVSLVAVEGATLVGMCAVIRDADSPQAQLVAMWVDPVHRSRGIGAELATAAAEWCRHEGISSIGLWVNEDNSPAIHLYLEQGFVPTGERQPLRPRSRATMIAMSRTLDSPPMSDTGTSG